MNDANASRKCKRWAGFSTVAVLSIAYAQDGLLLNCKLEGGYEDNQIYINEGKGYVIYNAQLSQSYERKREFEGGDGKSVIIDVSLEITFSDDNILLARDSSASFVFVKKTSTFAYAWTQPIPLENGTYLAFGNHHQGKCSINSFQPDE